MTRGSFAAGIHGKYKRGFGNPILENRTSVQSGYIIIYESNQSEYSQYLNVSLSRTWNRLSPHLVLAEGGSLEADKSEQDCQPSGFGRFAHFLTEASTSTWVIYLRIQHLGWSMREPARSSVCLTAM